MWLRRSELVLLALVACGDAPVKSAAEVDPVSSSASAEPDVKPEEAPERERTYEVRVEVILRPKGKTKRTFWLYRPEPLPEKPGLVIIAPAGSSMLAGKALDPDVREEHTPYVKAGFVVMAYSLDGDIRPGMRLDAAQGAIEAYRASNGGVDNAKLALDLAFEREPTIDDKRVFAAGTDSAGAHALLVAAEEPRVRGVVVYGPVTRFEGDKAAVMQIDRVMPGYASFFSSTMPENRVGDVRVPVFIHQSKEDRVVRASQTRSYAKALGEQGRGVDYVEVPIGDHRESMLQDGIPRAIAWMKKR